MANEDPLNEAKRILHLAVNYDQDSNVPKAIEHYVRGVEMLGDYIKTCKDPVRVKKINESISQYLRQAESLKAKSKEILSSKIVEIKKIEEDSIGHSYENLFKHVLNEKVTVVEVEDPYIDKMHQKNNFVRFVELLVVHAPRLKKITLTTKESGLDNEFVSGLSASLKARGIEFRVYFKDFHDREIRFNNGWVVKSGRGLDIYKPAEHKFGVGFFDLNLRPCRSCEVHYYRPAE
ncbi:hypothetical protein FO519_001993 [Halicephalobus sp. NKZ332]|nr:hypothetical protein FO519_001993 [Halicephalobus sp. NKZ332]